MSNKNLNTGNRRRTLYRFFLDNKKENLNFKKIFPHALAGESQEKLLMKKFSIFFSKIMFSVHFFLKNNFSIKICFIRIPRFLLQVDSSKPGLALKNTQPNVLTEFDLQVFIS